MIGELSPWHLLILAAVILVLFGAKKLPDSARSLGRAMRIFKSETSSLRGDHSDGEDDAKAQAAPQQQLAAPQPARTAETAGAASAPQPEAQHTNQPG